MAQTKVKVEHEGSDIGAVTGGVVTGATTAAVIFATTTDVAHNLQVSGNNVFTALQQTAGDAIHTVTDGLKGAGDFVKDNLAQAKAATEQAKKAATGVDSQGAANMLNDPGIGHRAKEGFVQIRDTAGATFEALQEKAVGLWQKFEEIENPKIKAAILASAIIVPVVVTAVATNAMNPETEVEVKSQDTKVASQSKGATRIQSGELSFN